ncbi:MAG: hypothetical protein HZB51_10710 [Chloroflexi bacterium]|nr:hypothetical protein [Chloroflexota bacterium]
MNAPDFSRYDPTLSDAITNALANIGAALERLMPLSGPFVRDWLKYLAGTNEPADYYHQVPISPMFWFPWFLEKALHPNPDSSFQSDLVYSTINGYYYIRLIDNLTDHHATVELSLLPALGFFHTQFHLPYQKYFVADHPFWNFFATVWFHSADVTMMDAKMVEQDQTQFRQIAAQKICAIKIPLAAVCYQYGQPALIAPWAQFVDSFGGWHQMYSDLFHWHEDASQATETFFLSEARRRKLAHESVADWVIREGFQWGLDCLNEWMTEVQTQAHKLDNADLLHYLNYRQTTARAAGAEVIAALQSASKLSSLLF